MAKEVRLPRLGETMDEGTIVECKVGVDGCVRSGDVLFEIETDKATLEIESPADGYVKHIMAKVGQNYRVGTPLLVIGEKDEQISDDFIRSLKTVVPSSLRFAGAGREQRTDDRKQDIRKSGYQEVRKENGRQKAEGKQIPVSRFHKLAAQKMLRSKQEIPCFYLNVKADVTELVAYRAKINEAGSIKVAYNDFIIKAVAMGLVRFPIMTGQLAGDSIRLADSIGVGLAVAVPEGLVAPVVKNADKKTIVEIARCTKQLADKAGDNELAPQDLEGGCITVSNLGAYGIDSFIPIVVPGQCSILGIGRIKDACVPGDSPDRIGVNPPYDGRVNIRKIMNMTLSVDHKVANGAYASQFLEFVKKTLETPLNLNDGCDSSL
jgi:pyruvate dehydrogenase E2 component (dihydrolipoamide acetyltransferase)